MRKLWTHRTLDAPADAVWGVFADPGRWPDWGPSVKNVQLDGDRLELGATGTIDTLPGAALRFEITRFEPGRRWAWKVAGVDATDHSVDPVDDHSCRAGFGVPWIVAPYLAVCRVALQRIATMAEREVRA